MDFATNYAELGNEHASTKKLVHILENCNRFQVGYGVTANIAASHKTTRQLGVRLPVSELFFLVMASHRVYKTSAENALACVGLCGWFWELSISPVLPRHPSFYTTIHLWLLP